MHAPKGRFVARAVQWQVLRCHCHGLRGQVRPLRCGRCVVARNRLIHAAYSVFKKSITHCTKRDTTISLNILQCVRCATKVPRNCCVRFTEPNLSSRKKKSHSRGPNGRQAGINSDFHVGVGDGRGDGEVRPYRKRCHCDDAFGVRRLGPTDLFAVDCLRRPALAYFCGWFDC